MKNKGVALVEIVVSMIILAVAALAVTSTISMVNSKQMRSQGGSSLDLQALSFARETSEMLKNAVSTKTGTGEAGNPLVDSNYTAPCQTAAGVACGGGTVHSSEALPLNGLPTSDLKDKASGARTYTVWDISSGNCSPETNPACQSGTNDVAYKKVIVAVTWTD